MKQVTILHVHGTHYTLHTAHQQQSTATTKWNSQFILFLLFTRALYFIWIIYLAQYSMDFQLKRNSKTTSETYFKSISNSIFVYESLYEVWWWMRSMMVGRMHFVGIQHYEWMNDPNASWMDAWVRVPTRTSKTMKICASTPTSWFSILFPIYVLACNVRTFHWNATSIYDSIHFSRRHTFHNIILFFFSQSIARSISVGLSVRSSAVWVLSAWFFTQTQTHLNGCGKLLNGTNIKIKRMDY